MGRFFRIKLHLRRFARRHRWLINSIRSLMIFSAAFGGAYGFIVGSRAENSGYDPNSFAIGASFHVRARLPRTRHREHAAGASCARKMRKLALHNEALADRNWELQEAEQRARSLFESQSDLIVMRDAEGPHHLRQRYLLPGGRNVRAKR